MKVLKIQKDRNLIDPNFDGYKLSLAGAATSCSALQADDGPEHRQPGSDQYSFLHAKLFGEHNHLVCDPWGEAVYWVGRGGGLLCAKEGEIRQLWQLPTASKEGVKEYNKALFFIGETEAVVSDGLGQLYVVDTGKRDREGSRWKTMFQGDVCGSGRPFVVVGGRVGTGGGEMEVVVQYVEHRDVVEGVRLPKESEGDFLNCLDWISFSFGDMEGNADLRMERVRRIVSQGGVNYIGVVQGDMGEARLVLSVERDAVLVFDSMDPVTEDAEQDETVANGDNHGEPPVFYWSQLGEEDLEVWLYVGEVVKSAVKVRVENRRLSVEVRGVETLSGELAAPVEEDSWTWSLEGGKLSVILTKIMEGPWPSLWSRAGGSPGQQVTDLKEDTVLAHLTSESPLTGLQPPESQPGFNSEQLEDCDSCDVKNRLLWIGGGEAAMATLEGRQHLLTLPSSSSSTPQLCTRYDVDGLVWRLHGEGAEHQATFSALGYVQASKTSRKFLAAPSSARYCVICDSSRHVYVYRQPEALPEEMGLRNRKSGQKVEKVAKQQVVTLDASGEILGLVAGERTIWVLTQTGLWMITVD